VLVLAFTLNPDSKVDVYCKQSTSQINLTETAQLNMSLNPIIQVRKLIFFLLSISSVLFLLTVQLGCSRVADEPMPIKDSVRVGLVAHFPLQQTPRDITGNNPDLDLIDASFKLSARADKAGEYALHFNGNSGSFARMYINNARAVNGALSISFWAKELGDGSFSPRIFEFWPGNYGPGFYWFNWYQGKIKWAGPDFQTSLDTLYNRNQWYHFVVSHDVNAIRIYANGKRVYNENLMGSIPPAAIQLARYGELGRLAQRPADAFHGAVIDFRIYNRVLSQNEVSYLFQQ